MEYLKWKYCLKFSYGVLKVKILFKIIGKFYVSYLSNHRIHIQVHIGLAYKFENTQEKTIIKVDMNLPYVIF